MSAAKIDVAQLLTKLGIKAKRQGPKFVASCPSPAHNDSSPSWSIINDPRSDKHGSHRCFGCSLQGGPWELAAAVHGSSLEEAGVWVWKELGVGREARIGDVPRVVVRSIGQRERPRFELPFGVQIPSVDGSSWFAPALDYLHARGIPDWQIERWHIGFARIGRCALRVVIPIHTAGELYSYVARRIVNDEAPRYDVARQTDPGARPDFALFGEPAFEGKRVVTVAEGCFSMMALERAGAPNPCAVLGVENLGDDKIDLLSRFETMLVATDPDRAGDACMRALSSKLGRYVELRRVQLRVSPDDASDQENAERIAEVWAGEDVAQ